MSNLTPKIRTKTSLKNVCKHDEGEGCNDRIDA